jgi:flavin-dependent dehydrogenase
MWVSESQSLRKEEGEMLDVAIIGGGPAGVAAALSARQLMIEASITIFDAGYAEQWKPGETLSPVAMPILESLGCGAALQKAFEQGTAIESFGTQAAWGAAEIHEREFLYSLHGNGWRLDRKRFDAVLLYCAEAAGIDVRREARLKGSAADDAGQWSLSFEAGQYRARFVIDATGRAARFAMLRGARISPSDQLAAVFVRFEAENDWDTLIEAAENGWWYSTGVPNGNAVAAWMSDTDLIREMNLRSAARWNALLAESVHTRHRVENARALGPPMIFGAQSHILRPMGGHGWLAAGDAAMAFDPLSSQGITKALRSGKLASFVAADYLLSKVDTHQRYNEIGEQEYADYQRAKHAYYSEEQHWPTAPFWARRHTSA